jgi:hypothetical protein
MAVVNAIASILKAIVNVRTHLPSWIHSMSVHEQPQPIRPVNEQRRRLRLAKNYHEVSHIPPEAQAFANVLISISSGYRRRLRSHRQLPHVRQGGTS